MKTFLRVRTDGVVIGVSKVNSTPRKTQEFYYVPYEGGYISLAQTDGTVYVWDGELKKVPAPSAPDVTWDTSTENWIDRRSYEEKVAFTQAKIRTRRTELLFQSDWTQVADVPLTPEQKQAWQVYRQQLRDITDEYADATDINTVQWPTPPSV